MTYDSTDRNGALDTELDDTAEHQPPFRCSGFRTPSTCRNTIGSPQVQQVAKIYPSIPFNILQRYRWLGKTVHILRCPCHRYPNAPFASSSIGCVVRKSPGARTDVRTSFSESSPETSLASARHGVPKAGAVQTLSVHARSSRDETGTIPNAVPLQRPACSE